MEESGKPPMTDAEQRVAAALRQIDADGNTYSPFLAPLGIEHNAPLLAAALAAQGLAITEAPDAEGAVDLFATRLQETGRLVVARGEDRAAFAALRAVGIEQFEIVAPPSSVDDEGLRAAAEALASEVEAIDRSRRFVGSGFKVSVAELSALTKAAAKVRTALAASDGRSPL